MDDRKLQAVNTGLDQPTNVYGSKEDDTLALKTLSEIQLPSEQHRETLASEIVKSLGHLSEVSPFIPNLRESLTLIHHQRTIFLF